MTVASPRTVSMPTSGRTTQKIDPARAMSAVARRTRAETVTLVRSGPSSTVETSPTATPR
jgi:hypothetical protein